MLKAMRGNWERGRPDSSDKRGLRSDCPPVGESGTKKRSAEKLGWEFRYLYRN
jgi:hypothetical protein